MTAPGPHVPRSAPRTNPRSAAAETGTILWALLPLLTCGLGAPIAFGVALAKRRSPLTLLGLIVYSALSLVWFLLAGTFGAEAPLWADLVAYTALLIVTVGATMHLFMIRPLVWTPQREPSVPVARMSGHEVIDRARELRRQARAMAEADPMLAKRLGIGRPDLPRQFDDGGLIDLNHAPLHVLTSLPGVTEAGARQILDRVERLGPFESLGEVLLAIEISPTFEHHLHEYVVFIP